MSAQASHAPPMVGSTLAAVAGGGDRAVLEVCGIAHLRDRPRVGPVVPGDLISAHIDGLPALAVTITPPES